MMIRTLLIVCFVATGCWAIKAQGQTSDELIKVLVAQNTGRKARIKAASQLAQKPPSEVLPKLSKVQKDYGQHAREIDAWGTDHFAAGRKVSWEAAVVMSASYAWSDNLRNPKYTTLEKGTALLNLLRQQTETSRKARLLHELRFHWVEGAELEAVSLLRNDKDDWHFRYTAAEVLFDKTEFRYFDEAYLAALSAPLEGQEWFARLLLRKKAPEWEGRVLRYAFAVIQAQRAAHPDRLDYGYFIASSLGGYVGMQFVPNQSDPKYKGEHGLKDSFFIETVENALRWWGTNQSAYPQ